MLSFDKMKNELAALYSKIASMPAKDYPPAQIAAWIKECKNMGKDDLGQQIMDQWNRVIDKYPQTRVNWGAATKIGGASVKKNVFGGAEFSEWLAEQGGSEAAVSRAKKIKEPKVSAPALAIPEDNETPEEWQQQAAKTKVMLDQGQTAFKNVEEFIGFLKTSAADLERKIADYGPGGSKEKTKSGAPHKFTERVPKWQAELKAYMDKISEVEKKTKEAKKKFESAEKAYNNAPLTTVKYEKKAQEALSDVLGFILNMDDIKKQQDMLVKFQETLKKMDSQKAASVEKSAAFWDALFKAFNNFVDWASGAWQKLVDWVTGLFKSIDKFDDLANIRY